MTAINIPDDDDDDVGCSMFTSEKGAPSYRCSTIVPRFRVGVVVRGGNGAYRAVGAGTGDVSMESSS